MCVRTFINYLIHLAGILYQIKCTWKLVFNPLFKLTKNLEVCVWRNDLWQQPYIHLDFARKIIKVTEQQFLNKLSLSFWDFL